MNDTKIKEVSSAMQIPWYHHALTITKHDLNIFHKALSQC